MNERLKLKYLKTLNEESTLLLPFPFPADFLLPISAAFAVFACNPQRALTSAFAFPRTVAHTSAGDSSRHSALIGELYSFGS